jgi:hypothetical protein
MVTGSRASAVAALVLLATLAPSVRGVAARGSPIPAPRDVLGFTPGEDRRLADYASIAEYFRRLAAASDRVRLEEIGRSTLGRPMLLAVVSSPANLARLDRIREVQRRLADPRTVGSEGETRALMEDARVVVLVTYGVHSTEVGSTLSSTALAYRLATDDSADAREILDHSVVLIVPSLNPDGVDIVKRWYDASLGTAWEGQPPTELYHHYVGHDDNRDWYAFTQAETRAVVDRVYNVWFPHVVNDVHQQGAYGSRLFLPPYVEPFEPNVPPEIVAGASALGSAVAWALTSAGRTGVVTGAIYDAWTPARAYSHHHGGIRVLSETASARLASPITVKRDELAPGRNYDPRQASANFPAPWPGGTWRLTDVVDTMCESTWALLVECARSRDRLVEGFARVGREAVTHRASEPFAYLIPPEPALLGANTGGVRDAARRVLFDALARGDVEVRVASAPFVAGGTMRPAGTAVVAYDQPFGGFAKALLERQRYPDLRSAAGGAPVPPYDVTAHSLGLLCGFEVERVDAGFPMPAGVDYTVSDAAPAPVELHGRRIGLYRGATAPMDEGWTRWIFERFGVASTALDARDVTAGDLRARFDVVVLPDMSPADLSEGRAPGTAPPELTGGLGPAGAAALSAFVEAGGTLVALNEASTYAISALRLPVRDALAGVPRTAFYCPGSILAVDASSELAALGVPARTVAWFEDGPAFEPMRRAVGVRVLARFAAAPRVLASGWLLGADRVAGHGALVSIDRGRGRVVLFAFRPQYRGQAFATLPLLFGAIGGAL